MGNDKKSLSMSDRWDIDSAEGWGFDVVKNVDNENSDDEEKDS